MAVLSKPLVAGAVLASLANALPQKPDFAAIAVAPTVADGPSDVAATNGAEAVSLYTSFTVTGPTAAPSATGASKRSLDKRTDILSDLIETAWDATLGKMGELTKVASGVKAQVDGGNQNDIEGNIDNDGQIFIGKSCSWDGNDAQNGNLKNWKGGKIQLNSGKDAPKAPSFDWDLHSMTNEGALQFCGRGDTGGSKFNLQHGQTSNNKGLISYEQFFDNQGSDFSWKSSGYGDVYHDGAFRMLNVAFHHKQDIKGSGCWQIGKGGTFYLEDGVGNTAGFLFKGAALAGQSIHFNDPSGVLHLDQGAYKSNSNFGAKCYGFGKGNAIEFAQDIASFSYNKASGILTCKFGWFGLQSANIDIGKGYDSSKFAKRNNGAKYGNFNAIFYDGPAPSFSIPDKCVINQPICSDPPKPTTSSTSTAGPTTSSTSTAGPTTTTAQATTTAKPSSTAPVTTAPTETPSTCTNDPYTPYYKALEKGLTTDPALTRTDTAGQPCATTPEDGTYCGFINPQDPCAPQPDGYGPVPTEDTVSAFQNFDKLQALASAAPTVVPAAGQGKQYTQTFKDLDGASSAQSYLGLYNLKEYDVAKCASKCDCTELCTAFNIYAERDPLYNPSTEANQDFTVWGRVCPNPASMTTFKCTLWGSNLDESTATNKGDKRVDFQVAITASNGYDKTDVVVPPKPDNGWNAPKDCKKKAVDAPQYWLGSKFFPGPFNPLVCSNYANKQSEANHGSGDQKVKMFNAYYLHKNGKPWGTQCALYNSILEDKWATYAGEQSGSDKYECKQSWRYELS